LLPFGELLDVICQYCPTWDKWGFCQELPPYGRGIHQRNVYSAGNDQIRDEESTEEGHYTKNYQLI
jgi:hypothetical protein